MSTDEQLDRQKHIENCQMAIRKLGQPQLKSVSELLHPSDTEQGYDMKSASFFDVRIDPRLIPTLLEAFNVKPNDAQVHVELRAGQIADRNANGGVIGGLHYDDENGQYFVEIYTSLPGNIINMNVTATIGETAQVHFAMKADNLANAVVEELRHVSQRVHHLYDWSQASFMVKTKAEFLSIDYEEDAALYTTALGPLVAPYIDIQPFAMAEISEWYEVETDEAEAAFPRTLEQYLDKSNAAKLYDPDPKGQLMISKIEGITVPPDEVRISQLADEIHSLVTKGRIGYLEAKFLFGKLHEKLKYFGDVFGASYIAEQIALFGGI